MYFLHLFAPDDFMYAQHFFAMEIDNYPWETSNWKEYLNMSITFHYTNNEYRYWLQFDTLTDMGYFINKYVL